MIKQRVPTLYNILHFLFVVFLVLNCHSVYSAGVVDYHFDVICCLLAVIMLFHIHIFFLKALIIISLYLIYQIPLILHISSAEYLFTYIIKYVVFISVIIYLSQDSFFLHKTIQYFIEIIFCIALVSLFFYVFSNLFGIIHPTDKYMLSWGGEYEVDSYLGIYFTPSLVTGNTLSKNSAIFAEGPIWAALLSIATTFELFNFNRKKRWAYLFVFYLTLLTTNSTTAFIFFILSILFILYQQYKEIKSTIMKIMSRVMFVGLAGAALVGIFLILENKSSTGISFLLRADDIMVGLSAFKEHPLIGVGFGNETYRYDYFSEARNYINNEGQSSDFAILLATGGIYFISFYLFSLFKLCKLLGQEKNKWSLFWMFIYVLLISRIGATLLFFTLIATSLLTWTKHNRYGRYGVNFKVPFITRIN